MYEYAAECIKVVDGDTLDLKIDLGFKMTTVQRVRLAGINTPETNRKDEREEGLKSKAFVEEFVFWTGKDTKEPVFRDFYVANKLVVKTQKDKQGKYGRYIADIFNEKGESLCEALLINKLAKEVNYD